MTDNPSLKFRVSFNISFSLSTTYPILMNKYLGIFAMLIGFAAPLFGQSGWARPDGGSYTQATFSVFSSNDFYSGEGIFSEESNTFQQYSLQYYGEYGLSDQFTLTVDVPVLMFNRFSNTETTAGVGGLRLGLKSQLLKKFPLSAQVELDIPTNNGLSEVNTTVPNDMGEFEVVNIPTSDGEFNVWTTLAASQSLPDGKTYGSIFSSINFRTQGLSNQLRAGAEIGHLFADKVYLIGKLQIQDRLSNSGTPVESFLFGEGTTFTYYSITSFIRTGPHARIVASMANFSDWLVDRRNLFGGFTYQLGIAWEY